MMAVSFAGLLIIALAIALFAGLLLNERTRVMGMLILGLLAIGGLFAGLRVSSQPSTRVVQGKEIYVGDPLIEHQRLAAEARAQAEAARAQVAAEVLKNQRLTAQMADAVVQVSPDGNRLETYPDGMQIREDGNSQQRSLVRDADVNAAQRSFYTPYSSFSSYSNRSTFALWLFAAPFVVLAMAFVAMKAKKGALGGWPAALAFLGCLPLLLFFGTVSQIRREVRSGSDATVAEVPLSARSNSVTIRRSPKFGEDGRGVRIAMPQPVIPQGAGDREFAKVFAKELAGENTQTESAIGPTSIESIWDKLTGPRIELGSPKPANISPTKAEVAQAAKIILAASAPVADPFTQGWLVNAAKAIVQAVPKSKASESAADTLDEAIIASNSELLESLAADRLPSPQASVIHPLVELRLNKLDGPRPEWIDDPPQRVVNARRLAVAVSTDPFTTAEECRFQLQEKVEAVVEARLAQLATQANSGSQVHAAKLEWLGVEPEHLAEFCPQGEYEETITTSVGPMKRLHTLVEFTPPQEQVLLDRWLRYARMQNLEAVAGMSSLVVAGLALVYGLLKVDTWTRGYYTKRLFLGVPAAIIAVFFLSANVFGW